MNERSLEEERDFLLRSLRDLDDEHADGDLADDDYEALKAEYTTRAATVLRLLDSATPFSSTGGRQAARSRSKAGRRRLLAGALALAVVAGGAGYAVAHAAGERATGQEATGNLPEGGVDRITKAQVLVSEGKVLEAVKVYDDLLADDPENPVALAERGWLLSRVDPSLVDSGLASIDRAIAIDPTYPEAHFFRGMILWRAKDDPALGVESFQRAIDAKPPADVRTQIEAVLEQAKADAASRAGVP
ncbi:MAG TPA: tetratricopeptide repeat protein [Acidimicrobiales bacterium]|nr:tetratricopeptide repeat protein [Acidimicrobiales bacterium]